MLEIRDLGLDSFEAKVQSCRLNEVFRKEEGSASSRISFSMGGLNSLNRVLQYNLVKLSYRIPGNSIGIVGLKEQY